MPMGNVLRVFVGELLVWHSFLAQNYILSSERENFTFVQLEARACKRIFVNINFSS